MPESILELCEEHIKRRAKRITFFYEDYEDVAQEMRLKIFEMPEGYEIGYYLNAASNVGVNYIRRLYGRGNRKMVNIDSVIL